MFNLELKRLIKVFLVAVFQVVDRNHSFVDAVQLELLGLLRCRSSSCATAPCGLCCSRKSKGGFSILVRLTKGFQYFGTGSSFLLSRPVSRNYIRNSKRNCKC